MCAGLFIKNIKKYLNWHNIWNLKTSLNHINNRAKYENNNHAILCIK